MAGASSMCGPSDIDLKSVHAVVEWPGPDGQKRYLYQHAPDPSRQVTCDVHFTAASGAALFKLKVPVGLKALPKDRTRTPLLLYVQGDRISSLEYDVPESVPDAVRDKFGTAPSRLQFSLTRPADMVGPLVSLAPRNMGHGDTIDSLKTLAQQTRFSIYLSHPSLSEGLLRPVCEAAAKGTLICLDTAADMRGLYGGAGAKLLGGAELDGTVPTTSPPPYNELAPSPRQAPPKPAIAPANPSKKRRRGSSSSAAGKTDADVMVTCKAMVDNMMEQFRQEERAYLHHQLQQMRESFSEDLLKVESDIMGHVDKRLVELEQTLCDEDDVDNQISQHVANFDELFDDKIEDRVTGIRLELEEFVQDELAAAEERVMDRVREVRWTVSLDE